MIARHTEARFLGIFGEPRVNVLLLNLDLVEHDDIAAAIRMTSPDQVRVIEHAAAVARQHAEPCFVISVVPSLPYGDGADEIVRENMEAIMREKCAPVMQEGDDVPQTLLTVARGFGVRTLFLRSGTTVERLLTLHPPFDVVVMGNSA